MPSGSFRYTKTKDSMGLYVFALDWSHKDFHDRTISIPLKIKGYVSFNRKDVERYLPVADHS